MFFHNFFQMMAVGASANVHAPFSNQLYVTCAPSYRRVEISQEDDKIPSRKLFQQLVGQLVDILLIRRYQPFVGDIHTYYEDIAGALHDVEEQNESSER